MGSTFGNSTVEKAILFTFRDCHVACAPRNDVFIFDFEPTLRSESREQVYLCYAEPRGGNEDLLLVIMNYKKTAGAISRLSPLYEPSIYSL